MSPKIHYDQTYSPVAAWESISILLYTILHNHWKTINLDYMLAFTQAPVKREFYKMIKKALKYRATSSFYSRLRKISMGRASQAEYGINS